MTNAIRAEMRKFFSTRLWWGFAIGFVLAGAAFALLMGALVYSSPDFKQQLGGPLTDVKRANGVYTAFLSVGYLLMLAVGVMSVGSEFRHRTITATFLATPKRLTVMLAKVVSLVVIGAGYAVVALVGSVAVGAVILTIQGHPVIPAAQTLRTLALSLLVLGIWALIGLGIGILITNQVAALLIGIGAFWIVEPLVMMGLNAFEFGADYLAPYTPSQATAAVVASVAGTPNAQPLDWWAGALVLVGWAAVFAVPGIMRMLRRDIS